MSDLHDSTFIINDIQLSIPPTQIKVNTHGAIQQFNVVRNRTSIKTKSRNTSLTVTLQIQFVGEEDINSKLLPLLAQIKLTPFCYVENQFLRDSIMGESGEDQNMAFAVNQITIATIPGFQKTLGVTIDMVWFNYKPYTANFYFKDTPFLPVASRQPGMAFKAFYYPTLKNYEPIHFSNSDCQFSLFEFLIGPADEFERSQNIELDFTKPEVGKFNELLNEYLDVAETLASKETDTLDGSSVVLDTIVDMSFRFQGGDPTLTRPQGISQINAEAARITQLFQELNIKTTAEDEDVKKLLAKQRELIEISADLYVGGDIWLEFPPALMQGNNRTSSPNSNTPAQSKLYYRKRILRAGPTESGLIIEQLVSATGHNLTTIPMAGYQYPTIQYMGGVDTQFFLKLKILNDAANQEVTSFTNIYNNNLNFARLIPQEYCNIKVVNDLINFCGIKDLAFSNKESGTIPGSPGTYDLTLEFMEAGVLPGEIEGIKAIPTSFGEVRRKIWQTIWKNISALPLTNRRELGSYSTSGIQLNVASGLPRADTQALDDVVKKISPTVNQILKRIEAKYLDTDISSSFTDKNSYAITNMVILSGLKDTEVLGVEGLSNAIWSISPTVFSYEFRNQDPSLLAQRPELAKRQEYLNTTHVERTVDKFKKLTAAQELYREYKKMREVPGGSDSSILKAIRPDGSFFYLDQELKEIGMDDGFIETLTKLAEQDKINQSSFIRNLAASGPFSPEKFIDIQFAELESELQGIETDKTTYGRIASVADRLFGALAPAEFRVWVPLVQAIADEIINSEMINLEVFKEAKAILTEMGRKFGGQVYKDFPMKEIEDFLRQALTVNYPDGITLEPDFYFYNETSDGNFNDFILPEDIEQTRSFARSYAENIVKKDTTWYQDYYRQEHNGSYQSMLDKSSSNVLMQSPDSNLSSVSASSQLTKPLSIGKLSTNNQTSGRGSFIVADENQGNLNSIGQSIPQPQSIINFKNTPESAVDTPNNNMTLSSEYSQASEDWDLPLSGRVRITSPPGLRNRPYAGASSYHAGTDLGFIGGATVSRGKPVLAAAEGEVVRKVVWDGSSIGQGNAVYLRTQYLGEEYFHKYMHLDSIVETIQEGEIIPKGTVIGYLGKTGTQIEHLHFEVRKYSLGGDIVYPFGTYQPKAITEQRGETPIVIENLIPFGQNKAWANSVPEINPLQAGETMFDMSLQSMKKSINKNTGYRMNRAYPGIWVSFIEEKSHGVVLKYEGFFSYQSIVSMEMSRDREVPADYCNLVLTNISNILTSKKYIGTDKENTTVAEKRLNVSDKNSIRETYLDAFFLQEGMKVELRLGYSNNPDKLTDVLVGRITGLQFGETSDIVSLQIQSLATELTQDLKGQDKTKEFTNRGSNDAWTGPLLTELMNSPEAVSFGAWKRGDQITNNNRGVLNKRWVWNPNPQTDNIFCPPAHELTNIEDSIESISGNFGLLDNLKYRLYQMTIWDVFKEMELRHPEWIGSPVPYTEANGSVKRMTMFFGLPDQLYYKRDPSLTENRKTQEITNKKEEFKRAIKAAERAGGLIDHVEDLLENSAADPSEIDQILQELRSYSHHSTEERDFKVEKRMDEIIDVHLNSEVLKEALENGSIEPFRKYHLITGSQHIIANNIGAKSSNTFNAITVQYSPTGQIDVEARNGPQINDAQTFSIKMDPHIPDELTRENFVVYPNCQGEEMAKRYALSLLQKSAWYTYHGDLVILGNPDIKPYDICYIFDEYSDMRGPIQVRRVIHYFSREDGFITVITPDLVTFVSEGASLTQNQAMGLMAEGFLKKTFNTNKINLITPGRTPLDGVQTAPLFYELAVAGAKLVNFFGGKRMIFRTQFGQPIRVHPLFQSGKPMVAGLGVIAERKNMFILNDIKEAFQEAQVGINEFVDDFTERLQSGRYFFNPQGDFNLFSDGSTANIRVRYNPNE
jgi:murein DD-endopeptidase MepM/ murein hydrolase activator NlpD